MNNKISEKDQKDWEEFLLKNERLPNKDLKSTKKNLKIKKIYDTWVFSRDIRTNNPNWQLIDTLT